MRQTEVLPRTVKTLPREGRCLKYYFSSIRKVIPSQHVRFKKIQKRKKKEKSPSLELTTLNILVFTFYFICIHTQICLGVNIECFK